MSRLNRASGGYATHDHVAGSRRGTPSVGELSVLASVPVIFHGGDEFVWVILLLGAG
jgi:hypothetical protein